MSRHPTIAECEAAGKGPQNGPGRPFISGGLPDTPEERARFEAYMRGHCWHVGKYSVKQRGYAEMLTRMLYGVWRDRGALPVPCKGGHQGQLPDVDYKKWHYGPPPSEGWWPASVYQDPTAFRWYSRLGGWSRPARHELDPGRAALAARQKTRDLLPIQWRHRPADWPDRSRT